MRVKLKRERLAAKEKFITGKRTSRTSKVATAGIEDEDLEMQGSASRLRGLNLNLAGDQQTDGTLSFCTVCSFLGPFPLSLILPQWS